VTDRTLIFGERHLRLILAEYAAHYNGRRPHRSRELRPPRPRSPCRRPLPGADQASARSRRPPQRIRASRVEAQVKTGGQVLEPHRVKFMIRDRGSNFTSAFDAVLADAGIRTVLCNVQTPRMNAITECWIGGCRRELLDRTLVCNQDHLRRILRDYETHHNQHRPRRSLHAAAPLKPLPKPVDLDRYRIRKRTRAGGLINEYRLVA
jgi:Integrase core domain